MTKEMKIKKLERFTERLRKIPEIRAVFYTGSTATKTWNRYSDVDIDIVVRDKDYTRIVSRLPNLLSMWGEVRLCNHYHGIDETYAFIGKDYEKVELDPIKESLLESTLQKMSGEIRIGFDRDGRLTRLLAKTKRNNKINPNPKEFTHLLLDTRSNLIYIANHYARGQKLESVEQFDGVREDLFYLLAQLKGHEDWSLRRRAESLLTKEEFNLFMKARFHSYDKQEVKRAMQATWDFLYYIEKQYERKTKRKLNLKCNDKEIKQVIGAFLK
jgi:predicted nucleotidyltransferase